VATTLLYAIDNSQLAMIMKNMNEKIMPENQGEEKTDFGELPKQEIPEGQIIAERAKAEELKGRLDALKEKNGWVVNDKIVAFTTVLRNEFLVNDLTKSIFEKDKILQNYVLFHILRGSTYGEGDCEFFDFPDEYSVEKFIERLEEEQGGNKDKN